MEYNITGLRNSAATSRMMDALCLQPIEMSH